MAIIVKKNKLELTVNFDKNSYYRKGNKGPFLQLKKSLTSLCALFSLLQLRSMYVYKSLKKFQPSKLLEINRETKRNLAGKGTPIEIRVAFPWFRPGIRKYVYHGARQ